MSPSTSHAFIGRPVWASFHGSVQSERVRPDGTNAQSPQRGSTVRDRHSDHLRAVRDTSCIRLKHHRYIATSPSHLINHLVCRNLHLLALRISQHLALRPDPVLRHWASSKIARAGGEDDEVIRRAIVSKFEKDGEKGANYAEIAKKAWEAGRVRLATMVGR